MQHSISADKHPKIIISGATGFIGRHCLSQLLNLGFEVHAFTRSTSSVNNNHIALDLQHDQLFWHAIDLQDAAQVQELVSTISANLLMDLA